MTDRAPTDSLLEEFSFEEVERILNKPNAPKEIILKTIVKYMNRFFAVIKGTNPMYVEKTIKINYPQNGKTIPRRRHKEKDSDSDSDSENEEDDGFGREEHAAKVKLTNRNFDSRDDDTNAESIVEEEMSHISIESQYVSLEKGATAVIEYIFRTEKGFKAAMANKQITIITDKKEVSKNRTRTVKEEQILSLYDLWIKSPYRREYDRMSFVERADEKSFNMFHGLTVEKEDLDEFDPEDATPWLQHIKDIWCRGDHQVFVWMLKMLARKVQFPFKKSKVALVLKGRQGCGKGIILEPIRKIFGNYFKTLRPNEFLGDFNGALADTLMLFLDESVFSGDRRVASQLKTLITEPTIMINQKHLPSFVIENNIDVIFATNYQQAVMVEEGDRRYFCLECDPVWAGKATKESVEYFRTIAKIPYQSIYKFLCSVNVDDFEPTIYPTTSAIREQKIYGMDTVVGWVYHSIEEKKAWLTKVNLIPRQNLYHEYTDYVKALGGHYGRAFSLLQWERRLKDCGIERSEDKSMLKIPRLKYIKAAMRDLLNDDTFPKLEENSDDEDSEEVRRKGDEDREEMSINDEDSDVDDEEKEEKEEEKKKSTLKVKKQDKEEESTKSTSSNARKSHRRRRRIDY